jgi:hypothetical protein
MGIMATATEVRRNNHSHRLVMVGFGRRVPSGLLKRRWEKSRGVILFHLPLFIVHLSLLTPGDSDNDK